MEEDVHEVREDGDPDRDQEDGGEHASFVRRLGRPAAAVDPLLTPLDAILTGPPLESET
ncbi:hypothetical protein GCM10027039_18400 [Terrabacter koreensis]